MNKIRRGKITEVLEEHASFIVPLMITYVFGIFFVLITYYGNDELQTSGNICRNLFKLVLDSMAPTTITYVLGEAIHNTISLYKRKIGHHYIWTIFTLISVGIYEIVFLLYTMVASLTWMWIIFVSTLLLLLLNAVSYKDYYLAVNRNHKLI